MGRDCSTCPQRADCKKLCADVEAQLPGPDAGKLLRRVNVGVDLSDIQDLPDLRKPAIEGRAVVRDMIAACPTLSRRTKRIATLYLWGGISQQEIANRYGVSQQCIAKTIQRVVVNLGANEGTR